MVTDNIYLYHLDAEVQKLYIRDSYNIKYQKKIRQHFSNVTRIAYLLCKKKLYIPLSNYLESNLAFDILNEFSKIEYAEANPLVFLSTAPNLNIALNKKENEHRDNYLVNPNFCYKKFCDTGAYLPGEFKTRARSASKDIEEALITSIDKEKLWIPFKQYLTPSLSFEQMQYQLANIPQRLSGLAYISDYMLPLLSVDPQMKAYADRQMNINVTRWYLESFLNELDAICIKDINYINESEILPNIPQREHLSYQLYVNKLLQKIIRPRKFFLEEQNAFNFIANCSMEELTIFKFSKTWADILSMDEDQNKKIYFIEREKMIYNDVKIGIIAALPEEAAAIEVLLEDVNSINFDIGKSVAGNRYKIGKVKALDGGFHKVVVCLLPDMGNNLATAVATKMQTYFPSMDNIIVCGIAGGIPQKVHLGDVIVSTNGVIQYDYGKNIFINGSSDFEEKDSGTPCSLFLREAVAFLQKEALIDGDKWTKYITKINSLVSADFSIPNWEYEEYFEKTEKGDYDKVSRKVSKHSHLHFGKVASGNIVQKDPTKRDSLYEKYKVIAIEMEASGIKDATRLQSNGYIAIRGICDFCDGTKGDDWHNYAAAVAAAYTYALIESIPTNK